MSAAFHPVESSDPCGSEICMRVYRNFYVKASIATIGRVHCRKNRCVIASFCVCAARVKGLVESHRMSKRWTGWTAHPKHAFGNLV